MGNEDNKDKSVADRKALQAAVLCIALSLILFFTLSSQQNRSDKYVQSIKRGTDEREYSLRVELSFGEEYYSSDAEISVKPEKALTDSVNANTEKGENWLAEFASDLIDRLSADTKGDSLDLPSDSEGIKIQWILPKEDEPTWIIAFGFFVAIFIWFSRYDEIKRKEKADRVALEYEIPNMSRQIVLLLNAGLICDSAFLQLNEQTANNRNPLYKQMRRLHEKSAADNSSFSANLYNFALDYGNRDLIRFATLVFEHSGRGSELASKLEDEANLQYESRLSMAKARAKEAETKLCFPLMLLLIALVIICITPAMAEV